MATPGNLPPELVRAGVNRARELDVGSVLASGGDPFALIMKTTKTLGSDEALHLVLPFEPAPLYEVMRALGRAALTQRAGSDVHVWFYPDATRQQQPASDDRAPLLPPVQLDVRELEPPQPMIAILQKLTELGPGAQLVVEHHREPVLLYEKLQLRGYAARTTKRCEGSYVIRIAPAWAFEDGAAP